MSSSDSNSYVSSSSSQSDSPIVGPSPFSRVPTEIKAVITALAAQQDQKYEQRIKKAFSKRQKDLVKGGARRWDGKSVNALFLVITPKRCGDSVFSFGIAVRYAKSIEEAIFDRHKTNHGRAALLGKLPTFTNLRHISLSETAFDQFLGLKDVRAQNDDDTETPSVEQHLHRSALQEVLKRIPEVSLVGIYLPQLSWTLPTLAHVKRLSILCYVPQEDERIVSARRELSRIANLEHLALPDLFSHSLRLIDDPATVWRFGSTLKSLEASISDDAPLSEPSWKFFESFSTSLEKLQLTIETEELTEALIRRAEEGGSKTTFSKLTHLQLQAPATVLKHLLSLLAFSPVHTLVLIADDDEDNEENTSPEVLLPLLQHTIDLFPASLQQVSLLAATFDSPSTFVRSDALADLFALASKHKIALTIEPLYDPFRHPPRRSDPPSFPVACDAAEDTLRFGLAHSARLRETKDVEGTKELLGLLMPLRGKMLREKD